jgi:hypothetical protein
VRIGLTLEHDLEAITAAGRWTAVGKLRVTPHASISIRGAGRDALRRSATRAARATEAIDRFEQARKKHRR